MTTPQYDVPVLYLVFNRPDHTRRSFEAIRARRPTRLFVAADGPRAHALNDWQRTEEVRRIATAVDWPCDLRTFFRAVNVGSRTAIPKAISWFFTQVSEGIILEDDCVPNDSFFTFCAELLARYRNHPRISSIAGTNPLDGLSRHTEDRSASYYFSRYSHTWGWATWRRAWLNRQNLPTDPRVRRAASTRALRNAQIRNPISRIFWARTIRNRVLVDVPNWDYHWQVSLWSQDLLSIIPSVNLITNIGYGEESTNTTWAESPLAERPTFSLPEPLTHPKNVTRSAQADAYFERKYVIPHLVFGHAKRRCMSALKARRSLSFVRSWRHEK